MRVVTGAYSLADFFATEPVIAVIVVNSVNVPYDGQ
jgi:hypothetical protein